jgi:hypothetical protein
LKPTRMRRKPFVTAGNNHDIVLASHWTFDEV